MGANGACSEWDFVKTVGQDAADKAFHDHWYGIRIFPSELRLKSLDC